MHLNITSDFPHDIRIDIEKWLLEIGKNPEVNMQEDLIKIVPKPNSRLRSQPVQGIITPGSIANIHVFMCTRCICNS
jgi:hypothetical protein